MQALLSVAPSVATVPTGIAARVAAYRDGRDAFADLDTVFDAIEAEGGKAVWISVMPRAAAHVLLAAAKERLEAGADLPLFGIPFAVKDNIDIAGLETTAGCPDFAFAPKQSAFVVERLIDAGAIPIGKTNLDQFATGLNGTRSPYGIPASAFDKTRVSGGSSSGSAVAVAKGLVAFALGTDTAGSGRVPAGFNNVVGLKPTRGLISTRGVLPACRTLDCVSIFAPTVGDAFAVLQACAQPDPLEPYSRAAPQPAEQAAGDKRHFGVVSDAVLARCARDVVVRYRASVAALQAKGLAPVEIDYAPLEEVASQLYAGPWVAERLAAIRGFAETMPDAIHPVVRDIILSGANYSAVDAFEAQYRVAEIALEARAIWQECDFLLLPTAPDHPTIDAMLEAPVELNSMLGLFTNFVNLLDMAALSVPAGFGESGLPIGVTLIGPAFSDARLAAIGDALHRLDDQATLGATSDRLAWSRPFELPADRSTIEVAVVGAHLSGQPLNHQLTGRGGKLVKSTRTATGYSLYALPDTTPAKPGLARDGGGGHIEIELWAMPLAAFGSFVAEIPAPLGIGSLETEEGRWVKGFICEGHALKSAEDITAFGGWRSYLNSKTTQSMPTS